MDGSTPAFAHTVDALRAAPEFTGDRGRSAYAAGRRAWIKAGCY